MKRRFSSNVACGLVGVVVLAGCTSASDISDGAKSPTLGASSSSTAGPAGSGMQRFLDQDVDWKSCNDGNQCATIWVPLDYSKPDGDAITIAMEMRPATDTANRIGSLFINPGGPGVSGIQFVEGNPLGAEITDVYDVIGFDPRGVGVSTPIDCVSDKQMDSFIAGDPTPQTDAEVQEFQSEFKTFADGCVAKSGPLLPYVSSVDVAQDLDLMRQLVGDDKLNFYGGSYGTYMGATYAGMFPDNVGQMVLDGAVDPLAPPIAGALIQARGFETAFKAYAEDCIQGGNCPLGNSTDEAEAKVDNLLGGLQDNPLPTADGRELTEGLGFYGLILPLYTKDLWPYLTQALQQAFDGKGDLLLLLSDFYTERQPDGSYQGNTLEAYSAIMCLDAPTTTTVGAIEQRAPRWDAAAPLFGESAAWGTYACSNWPAKSSEKKPDFAAKGAPPILVVGTTRDPATPYQQSVRLANILDSGVLLSRDGDGHTAYNSGNQCIDSTIDDFFAKGDVPPDGKMC